MKLLVIDIQKGITDSRLFNFDEFIENTTRIIQAARDNQIEVIYFQHDDGPGTGFSIGDEEFEIAEQVTPREGEKIFIKNINSCFGNKDFTDYVKNENTLMIVGLQTNFCIDATVKSAFERGYKVIVPQGANSTFDNDYMTGEVTYKYYNDMMWPDRFATCVSVDEAIKLMEKKKIQMLKTKDLILDKGKIDDWKALYENVWKHEETARYMMWSASQIEEEGYEMTQNYLKMQEVNPTAYIVYEKEGRVPVGFAGMRETDKGIFEDSGIAVGVAYTGKGYGKQILSALLSQAFEELGAQKFIYSCWAENIPSNKLAESAGLKFSRSEEAVDRRSGRVITMNYYER